MAAGRGHSVALKVAEQSNQDNDRDGDAEHKQQNGTHFLSSYD